MKNNNLNNNNVEISKIFMKIKTFFISQKSFINFKIYRYENSFFL